ncbi:hypothetical protein FQN54_000166 [Arachnomyces sp. PD_36]|nr:hypothetical protein FQN54_000166 [Arachnomyces sp. PD_36]
MPVTLKTADLQARKSGFSAVQDPDKFLERSFPEDFRRSEGIIQSSFPPQFFNENHVTPSSNGFVKTVFNAYCYHHHLVLRPEDVWFSILAQLNFYINAHPEELRSYFVAHEGQKELEVIDSGTISSVDFGALAIRMTHLIEKNVLDPDLRAWIMPAFSTTTESDRVVAAILMMGALQKYFTYKMSLMCGIPTVTLLGEREDWALLLSKIEKIPELGKEPTEFTDLLRPVLSRFVASFDDPESPDILEFWGKSVHYQSGGSGPSYLSGWITAFCFWDEDGNCLYPDRSLYTSKGTELDGVLFHRIDSDDIPPGAASVPVTVNDHGHVFQTRMLAGMVGIQSTPNRFALDGSNTHDQNEHGATATQVAPNKSPELDTLQPLSGWWMYKTDPAAAAARGGEKEKIKEELRAVRRRAHKADGSLDKDSIAQARKLSERLREL